MPPFENPLPGEVWWLQVTAVLTDGEVPMGMGSTCVVREVLTSCPGPGFPEF